MRFQNFPNRRKWLFPDFCKIKSSTVIFSRKFSPRKCLKFRHSPTHYAAIIAYKNLHYRCGMASWSTCMLVCGKRDLLHIPKHVTIIKIGWLHLLVDELRCKIVFVAGVVRIIWLRFASGFGRMVICCFVIFFFLVTRIHVVVVRSFQILDRVLSTVIGRSNFVLVFVKKKNWSTGWSWVIG